LSEGLSPIAETNGMHLVLFGTQNRKFGPCLAAIDGVLISEMAWRCVCYPLIAERGAHRSAAATWNRADGTSAERQSASGRPATGATAR
jgi:hypothetical protein